MRLLLAAGVSLLALVSGPVLAQSPEPPAEHPEAGEAGVGSPEEVLGG